MFIIPIESWAWFTCSCSSSYFKTHSTERTDKEPECYKEREGESARARGPDGGRDTGKGFFCEMDQRDRLSEGHGRKKKVESKEEMRYGRKERCLCQHKRNWWNRLILHWWGADTAEMCSLFKKPCVNCALHNPTLKLCVHYSVDCSFYFW